MGAPEGTPRPPTPGLNINRRRPTSRRAGPAARLPSPYEKLEQGQQTIIGLLEQILVELKAPRRIGGAPAEDLKPKNRGGRLEKYDWRDFYLEVIKIANLDGFSTRDELRRRMIDWITLNWPEQPGDAMLRGKLRKIGDYLKLPP